MRKSVIKAIKRKQRRGEGISRTAREILECNEFLRKGSAMLMGYELFDMDDVREGRAESILYSPELGLDAVTKYHVGKLLYRVSVALRDAKRYASKNAASAGLTNVFRRSRRIGMSDIAANDVYPLWERRRDRMEQVEGELEFPDIRQRYVSRINKLTCRAAGIVGSALKTVKSHWCDEYGYTYRTHERHLYVPEKATTEDIQAVWGHDKALFSDDFKIHRIPSNWIEDVYLSGMLDASPNRVLILSCELSGEFTEDFGTVYNVSGHKTRGRSYKDHKHEAWAGKAVCLQNEGKKFWGVAKTKHGATKIARERMSAALVKRLSNESGANSMAAGTSGGFL